MKCQILCWGHVYINGLISYSDKARKQRYIFNTRILIYRYSHTQNVNGISETMKSIHSFTTEIFLHLPRISIIKKQLHLYREQHGPKHKCRKEHVSFGETQNS